MEAHDTEPGYQENLQAWREDYQQKLLADTGWFSAAGLFWLEPGDTPFGRDLGGGLLLPEGDKHEAVGTFHLEGNTVRLQTPAGAPLRVGGRLVAEASFRLERDGDAEPIALGEQTIRIIRRGGRFAVRLYDKNAPSYRSFGGLNWFPVDPGYRLEARFEAYAQPETVKISTILGDVRDARVPGRAVFTLAGREHSLLPILAGKKLFFIFRDETSREETYPAGRFLYTDLPRNGSVMLDFNYATNPPCAYTDHATCPLPLPGNHLPVRIPVGEKRYVART
ncbi:MAG: DUF1684 domain-containing protein [Gemmatimonadota bacterium]|nr:MAG: DUF1684 domain-containing protein [Gemmatimonadota bacterium]